MGLHLTRLVALGILLLVMSALPSKLTAAQAIDSTTASGKVMAHVVDENGVVYTFDTDTDTVVSRKALTNLSVLAGGGVSSSSPDNILFVIDGTRLEFRIKVYELKSLAFKKDLGILASDVPEVLIPPQAPHFFVRWRDFRGQEVITRFEKALLTSLGEVPSVTWLGDQIFASSDGTRFYSYRTDTQDSINVVDARDLQLLSTIVLKPLFASGIWGGGVERILDHTALLVENAKMQRIDPDRLTLFRLRLTDGVQSRKIDTGLQGDGYFLPGADRILLHETVTRRGPQGENRGDQSVGRLHVYDVASGAKLGQVAMVLNGANAFFRGVRPQGDKAYFYAGRRDGGRRLMSVSVTTFSVVKEIPFEAGIVFMAFFNQ